MSKKNELKTLEDLEIKGFHSESKLNLNSNVVRQEIIKRIKKYDSQINMLIEKTNGTDAWCHNLLHTKKEFMEFFNLTEEDLE